MEYITLDKFTNRNSEEISKLLGKEIVDLSQIINEVKKSSHKSKKLFEITKDIVKILDFYDEKNKINLNRDAFTTSCLKKFEPMFSEQKIKDYEEMFKVIINQNLEFDESNWNKFYDTIVEAVAVSYESRDNSIDKNILYSLDFEDLTPKKLVAIFQRNINDEMIEGGTFSFQTHTQEMMGIINEFVISKGAKKIYKYLEQGKDNDIKITELLKEVNAASLVEPFTFREESPSFKRAAAGQFDGFILEKDSAKVILATKNENTNIENDSIFRHFVTAVVIKKKIDETKPSQRTINKKKKAWFEHYTSDKKIKEYTLACLDHGKKIKKDANANLTLRDFYIDESYVENLSEMVKEAEFLGHSRVRFMTKNDEMFPLIDRSVKKALFGEKKINSNVIQLEIDEAKEKVKIMKSMVKNQEKFKEELVSKIKEKLVSRKFKDQMFLDAKKEEMVLNAGFLSVKDMISDLNRNTKKGLVELGVFSEIDSPDSLGYDEMEKLKEKARELKVDLIYFGSVSGKKSTLENEYDRGFTDKSYKNKEYRYGLNLLAYANILSGAPKDNFKITTDASISFVNNVNLRAVTKEKDGIYDLDLEKINEKSFLKDVVYVTYKSIYENKLIENDSIDFFENLLNATNVILSDFKEDYKIDLEDNPKAKIEDSFNVTMKNNTGRDEEFDLVRTVDSLKTYLVENSKKINNVSLVDSLNQRLNEIIKISDNPEMKKVAGKYPLGESKKNKESRRKRRSFS